MFQAYSDIEWHAVKVFRNGRSFNVRSKSDSNYQMVLLSCLGIVTWFEHDNLHVGEIKFMSTLDGSVSGDLFKLCNWADGYNEPLIGFYIPEKGIEKRHLQVYYCKNGEITDDYVIYCTDVKEVSLNEALQNARR